MNGEAGQTEAGVMARFDARVVETVEVAPGGGTSDGLFQLGLMHCVGRDVPLDLIMAHKWFNLAALRGNAEAKRYRMEIAGEMTKSEVAEAQRHAREWLRRH
jgi:TPR repeat protein